VEWLVIAVIAVVVIVGGYFAIIIGLAALVVWPVTVALALIGWLIGGSTGAIVGVAIAGIISALVVLNKN
jgi:hypothetical protein